MDMFKKIVALRVTLQKLRKSQIFVLSENDASYEDLFRPQVF